VPRMGAQMSIEAMKQGLEALKTVWYHVGTFAPTDDAIELYDQARTSLRQAIEEAEKQEPYGYFRYDIRLDAWVQSRDSNKGVAFYTHPPKREWVGLTEEEIDQIYCTCHDNYDGRNKYERALEAKLREKNGC